MVAATNLLSLSQIIRGMIKELKIENESRL